VSFNLALKTLNSVKVDANHSSSSQNAHIREPIIQNADLSSLTRNQPDLYYKLDTEQVARTFNGIISIKNISVAALAKHLGFISQPFLNSLLIHPYPWEKCSVSAKRIYQLLDKWSQSEEDIRSLQISCSDEWDDLRLETASVAQKMIEVLRQHSITRTEFAKKFLEIGLTRFCDYLNHPPAWEKSCESRKRLFRRMRQWSISQEQ
jgi:hypothetical protein